jgi:hypothetical protein
MRLVVDARTSAFAAFVDYAGLFPPASLTVEEAVAGYRMSRTSSSAWVSGRFLVRASQLEELASVVTPILTVDDGPWEIGVVFDTSPAVAASQAAAFHAEMEPALAVAAAEVRIADPSRAGIQALVTTVGSINPDVVAFLEVLRSADVRSQIDAIGAALLEAGRGGGAKLRCGGITADLFPSTEEVAAFIYAAVDASVPFKATAGLHQPIRHFDESLDVWRHGFVNLLIATAAATAGEREEVVHEIVAETDPDSFAISPAFASWRDLRFPGSAVRRMRQHNFVAYGSCDFDEPVTALADMSLLGDGT